MSNVYPDPNIRFGHFRVLPSTDGGYVVIDERKPLGKKRVSKMLDLNDAANDAANRDAKDGAE